MVAELRARTTDALSTLAPGNYQNRRPALACQLHRGPGPAARTGQIISLAVAAPKMATAAPSPAGRVAARSSEKGCELGKLRCVLVPR